MRERLERIVPALLNHLQWNETLSEDLLDFFLTRAEDLERRFRDAVFGWLADFTNSRKLRYTVGVLSEADWLSIVRHATPQSTWRHNRPRTNQPSGCRSSAARCLRVDSVH